MIEENGATTKGKTMSKCYRFSFLNGESLTLEIDFAHGALPILFVDNDGETHRTPFCSADAKQSVWEALRLVIDHYGPEDFCDTDDERDEDQKLFALLAGATVEF